MTPDLPPLRPWQLILFGTVLAIVIAVCLCAVLNAAYTITPVSSTQLPTL